VIRLTGAEKRELRKLKRRGTAEARLLDRTRIILWADRDRTTIEETAHRLECGRDKVIFWRRRFLEGRAVKPPVIEHPQVPARNSVRFRPRHGAREKRVRGVWWSIIGMSLRL
jgi:hypothetical protein